MALRRRGLLAGSPPPARAATPISRMILVKILPRLASTRSCGLRWRDLVPMAYFRSLHEERRGLYLIARRDRVSRAGRSGSGGWAAGPEAAIAQERGGLARGLAGKHQAAVAGRGPRNGRPGPAGGSPPAPRCRRRPRRCAPNRLPSPRGTDRRRPRRPAACPPRPASPSSSGRRCGPERQRPATLGQRRGRCALPRNGEPRQTTRVHRQIRQRRRASSAISPPRLCPTSGDRAASHSRSTSCGTATSGAVRRRWNSPNDNRVSKPPCAQARQASGTSHQARAFQMPVHQQNGGSCTSPGAARIGGQQVGPADDTSRIRPGRIGRRTGVTQLPSGAATALVTGYSGVAGLRR